jgi:hypothetical protein
MSELRMSCGGCAVEDWWIPPFELRDGQSLTLYVPSGSLVHPDEPITAFLNRFGRAFEIHGQSAIAEPAVSPFGFFSWFKDHSATGWLRRRSGMTRSQAQDVIHRLRLHRDDIRYLNGSYRMLLGMEAALAKPSDLLIFSTTGANYASIQIAFAMAQQHCAQHAAVYLSFPYISQERMHYRDFPGSERVVITHRAHVAA